MAKGVPLRRLEAGWPRGPGGKHPSNAGLGGAPPKLVGWATRHVRFGEDDQ
jgi:hypothetical protein